MENLLIGFVTGAIFATWLHSLRNVHEKWADSPHRSVIRDTFNDKPKKPDLKKVRYYQSPEYKREKALIERYKKGAVE